MLRSHQLSTAGRSHRKKVEKVDVSLWERPFRPSERPFAHARRSPTRATEDLFAGTGGFYMGVRPASAATSPRDQRSARPAVGTPSSLRRSASAWNAATLSAFTYGTGNDVLSRRRRTTQPDPTVAGYGQRRLGVEPDQPPLVLGGGDEDVRGELAVRRRQVRALLDHDDGSRCGSGRDAELDFRRRPLRSPRRRPQTRRTPARRAC
jgi:hypothetical protein